MLALHQVVRVVRDVPEQGVIKGMIGGVVEVFELPQTAFEVEFVDGDGRTLLQATLAEDDLEAVGSDAPCFRTNDEATAGWK